MLRLSELRWPEPTTMSVSAIRTVEGTWSPGESLGSNQAKLLVGSARPCLDSLPPPVFGRPVAASNPIANRSRPDDSSPSPQALARLASTPDHDHTPRGICAESYCIRFVGPARPFLDRRLYFTLAPLRALPALTLFLFRPGTEYGNAKFVSFWGKSRRIHVGPAGQPF
ncbi:hypothetical protein EJ06DRAFT_44605 [Trichodelitschia bisporula]|uniref:Uncharacterized protein n=1 Tax=Trichodelitschia bisporula TaxID=703511 RepID=A0A6G1HW64_9PEZI|nr:hypothetical protein EJ06DRAFT_44605 [Trichodelitschia bisporula]